MSYAHVRELTVGNNGELHIRDLPLRAGDRVQVVVIPKQAVDPTADRYPLRGTAVRYDRPFDPACDPDEWEANR